MAFLIDKTTLKKALLQVPAQEAVDHFVENLDNQINLLLSYGVTPNQITLYLGSGGAQVVRFVIVIGATNSFSIQIKSPSTGAWVNKVTYSQT